MLEEGEKNTKRNKNMSQKKKDRNNGKNRWKICSGDRERNSPGSAWFEDELAVATSTSTGGTITRNVMIVEKMKNNILRADQLGDLKNSMKK